MTFSAPLKVTLRLIVFDIDPDTGEVYETTGQSADDRQTTSGRNNIKVVKIAPVKEA